MREGECAARYHRGPSDMSKARGARWEGWLEDSSSPVRHRHVRGTSGQQRVQELQCGSYIFMDGLRAEQRADGGQFDGFEHASELRYGVSVLATERVVIDAA